MRFNLSEIEELRGYFNANTEVLAELPGIKGYREGAMVIVGSGTVKCLYVLLGTEWVEISKGVHDGKH